MLTLQFIPHSEIEGLDSDARIKKLLDVVKEEKIVVLEGNVVLFHHVVVEQLG